jgi:hypothetical protein
MKLVVKIMLVHSGTPVCKSKNLVLSGDIEKIDHPETSI